MRIPRWKKWHFAATWERAPGAKVEVEVSAWSEESARRKVQEKFPHAYLTVDK